MKDEVDNQHNSRFAIAKDSHEQENGKIKRKHQNTHIQGYVPKPAFGDFGAEYRGETGYAAGGETVVV